MKEARGMAPNEGQQLAIDTTEGPVLVVAGPGTGKTQLLSQRVQKILENNPTILPSNILCLTFTDSAAANLRRRLIQSTNLGQGAYQVAIHTFNSFGSWIMATYPEYFGHWREVATADELTTYRIIETILARFPGNHALAGKTPDGTFVAAKQLLNLIGDSKRANISPKELESVLAHNSAMVDLVTPLVQKYWPKTMRDAGALEAIGELLSKLTAIEDKSPLEGVASLLSMLRADLEAASKAAELLPSRSKTKPLTEWKDHWLELDEQGAWRFKLAKHLPKLSAGAVVYETYQKELASKAMVDFSDQIMTILSALRQHEDLRLNLQERFQYLMIDEYQDTNRAQLELTRLVTDAAVHEGRPNILAVGDDDQAIYRFQGADISNIQAFTRAYRDPVIIPLTENYRSTAEILAPAKALGAQITDSLASSGQVDKLLTARATDGEPIGRGDSVQLIAGEYDSAQYAFVAEEIRRLIDQGVAGNDIVILARQRNQLDSLLPYLRHQAIPIAYERRENVLEQPHIMSLLSLVRLVCLLAEEKLAEVGELLPEILSHPMWQVAPAVLWRVSRDAQQSKRHWLDVIFEQQDSPLRPIADFFYELALNSKQLPLEQLLDRLIGADDDTQAAFHSPFKAYYFSAQLRESDPAQYLAFLSQLSTLRDALRRYQQGQATNLYLADLQIFVDAYARAGLVMIDQAPHTEATNAVQLMTVHKSKGMEFRCVFVIGMQDAVWNKRSGSNLSRLSYPPNLKLIEPDANDANDALRLLFVAMTRAKQRLYLTYCRQDDAGKQQQLFAPLSGLELAERVVKASTDPALLAEQYEARWLTRHASVPQTDMRAFLASSVESYSLSVTHLQNYLDVSRGGPAYFLTRNLLRFPTAPAPSASYGTAIHAALRACHEDAQQQAEPSVSRAMAVFQAELAKAHLSEYDTARLLQRGIEVLPRFLAREAKTFTAKQQAEVAITHDSQLDGGILLRGIIDVLSVDKASRSLSVLDYKTGHSFSGWQSAPSASEHMKIKQHHYRQQLLFYKLLLESSGQWGKQGWQVTDGEIVFVEPNDYGKIVHVPLQYEPEELARFEQLLRAVYRNIQTLEFPDTSSYEPTLDGILKFEDTLLEQAVSSSDIQ